MAYLNFLISVSEQQLQGLRKDSTTLLHPSLVIATSHLIGYWVEIQPLGGLLGQALDGGEKVNDELWHPLREPVFHTPSEVQVLYKKLTEAWQKARGPETDSDDFNWYRREINLVLRIFHHASEKEECIVSVLQPPADAERAQRVRLPFVAPGERTEPSKLTDASVPPPASTVEAKPPDSWPLWSVLGAVGVVLSTFTLCYWRYRRTRR